MSQSSLFLKNSQKICLEWKDFSLIDKKTEKYVLNQLSGEVRSGQFLTIMGPSGAGKSSFLSMITAKTSAYTSTFNLEGQTTLNKQKYTEDQFISIASYVPQDDLLMETLTVQQTFAFQANLKLSNLSQEQRNNRVKEVLLMLNLYEIRKSKVGGRQNKSISGGQKKRVAIGVELISNPMILVLDEPTSGLDSFNSLKIINLLTKLAKQEKKIIIATIHQPSSLMFQKFDKLMVMKNGQQIYHDCAHNMVQYLEKLEVKVDYRMNPADFFMLELSQFKQSQGYNTPMTSWAWQNWKSKGSMNINASLVSNDTVNINASQISEYVQKIDFNLHPPTPLVKQFRPLLARSFKSYIRTPTNQFGKLMQMIWYPLLIGVLFLDVVDRFPADLQDLPKLATFLREFTGFFYLGMFFTITIPLYDMILVFPLEKELVLKEVKSRMYSLEFYFALKLLIEVPSVLISTWITTTIVFFIVGLQATFSNWLIYEFAFSVIAFAGYLIGIIMGVLAKQPQYAVQAAPLIVTIMNLYAGCTVNLKTIPAYSGWVQYLDPLSYGYNVLMKSQLDTDKLENLGKYEALLDYLGISGNINQKMGALCLLTLGLFLASFLTLYLRRKFY